MGFADRVSAAFGIGRTDVDSKAVQEISKYYKIGSFDKADCDACSVCYPDSLSIDDGPLFNTAAPVAAQVLVATGQSNWKHNINDEETTWGRVCNQLDSSSDRLKEAAGGMIRINGTSQEVEDDDAPQVEVVVLPQFVKVLTDPEHCVDDVLAILAIEPGGPLPANSKPAPERGYILLCSHRQRDKRCGITAPLLKQALDIELRHNDLYRDLDDDEPGGVQVLFCNHVGGHKFAANALIYQNEGMAIMLARVRPEHAKFIVDKTLDKEEVLPELVRSCNRLKAYQW